MERKGEIVLYQLDENIRLEVRFEQETVWLSQSQMAELYGTQRQAITKHIKNIYGVNELESASTSSVLELVQKEGGRMVKRNVEFYNLDVIISVGYRVNTRQGIRFRRWAIDVLKSHLLRVYSINHQVHDRYLIIDDTVWLLGASVKDMGRGLCTVIEVAFTPDEVLGKLK